MLDARFDQSYTGLLVALREKASVDAIGNLLVGLKQETSKERTAARRALKMAMDCELGVFQMVLDATCKEVILPADVRAKSALFDAMPKGRKEIVLALVRRMRRETPYELDTSSLLAFFRSRVFDDEEVVDAVIGVTPYATFGPRRGIHDCLEYALRSDLVQTERVVELCLKHGPSMAERLEGRERFRYVTVAAASCDLKMVEKMHNLVPLMSDGSGRRGEDADYGNAISRAAHNRGRHSRDVNAIMEYLVEQGGVGALDHCLPSTVLSVPTEKDAEWLVTQAPHLLHAACKEPDCLKKLIAVSFTDYLTEQIAQLVDRETIVELMQQSCDPLVRRQFGAEGWRRKLEKLHEAVPECLDGLRWLWLREAIKEKAYSDAEYMVGKCTREHLVKRNKEGVTAYDVAARDVDFPPGVLIRLKTVAKGAHA